MADIRIRNISTYGEVEVPDLGLVVPHHHEVVVEAALAGRLIETGHFVKVDRAKPKSAAARESGKSASQTTSDTESATSNEEPSDDDAA